MKAPNYCTTVSHRHCHAAALRCCLTAVLLPGYLATLAGVYSTLPLKRALTVE